MPLKMLLLMFSTGRFRISASLFRTVGRVGNRRGVAAPKVARIYSGEYAPTHSGVQKPHRPADLVGFRSPPNLKRCAPFCQLNVSTNSNRRVLRPCGALKLGPRAGKLDPTNVYTLGRLPATQGKAQSEATACLL